MIAFVRRVRATIREDSEYRLGRRGTFLGRFALSRWRWSASLCLFEEGWFLHLFPWWIKLGRAKREPHEMMESWGFTWSNEDRCLHLNWGRRCKILHFPWAFEWVRSEEMLPDGRFVTKERLTRLPKWVLGYRRLSLHDGTMTPMRRGDPYRGLSYVPGRYEESFPYQYTLRSGDVQIRTATVTVGRMSWAWRMPARWFGIWWPRKVRTSINVDFSGEVGERTGSWKGGTIGCGYDLRLGESPEQCLRRMEQERKF